MILLTAKSLDEMAEMLRNLVKDSAKLGLKLNLTKTNVMVMSKMKKKILKINGKIIK